MNSFCRRFAVTCLLVTCLHVTWGAPAAMAHPGHGSIESGPAHYAGELTHSLPLAMIIIAGLLAGLAAVLGGRRASKKRSV